MITDEVQTCIEAGIPESRAIVTGSDGKFEAVVISDRFADISMVKAHQLVYATVRPQISSGELHALSIKAFTVEGWEQQQR